MRINDLEFNGLEKAVDKSASFDRIAKGVYEITAREVYGKTETPDLAIFAYGSPGRIEMVGGDSDADIFLVEKNRTEKSKKFKSLFKERLKSFDFSKVDMPDWGTFKEIRTYLKKSLVEGNQVLETRYLSGDITVDKELNYIKKRFDSVERGLKNIIFNRLYFNQYFKQRTNKGAPNIKYCNGGARDFLFIYWQDRLDRILDGDREELSYRPRVEIGLKRLFEQGKITKKELTNSLEAVNFMMVLRGDVLKLNRDLPERGLTFLDKPTFLRLREIGYPKPEEIKKIFEKHRKVMERVVGMVWEETLRKTEVIYGSEWGKQFRLAYDPYTPLGMRSSISPEDDLIRVGLIWGASNAGQKEFSDYLAKRYKDTEDWATIGSIVCSPHCKSDILRHFGTGILKQEGYGYLLRVVARHKNVDRSTLESIAYDSNLAQRYTEVARAALNGGHEEANRQI